MDLIEFPETNKNLYLEWVRNKWIGEVKRVWKHTNIYTASLTKPSDKHSEFQ